MAKETQDAVGEVDDMPTNDSANEGEDSETNVETNVDPHGGPEHEVPENASAPTPEAEREAGASAAPSLALWLTGELRQSPSKSVPPAAPVSVNPPETLAPVAVTPTELSDEDLAVLPIGSRPGEASSVRNGVLAVLAAAAAVFLFSYWWSVGASRPVHTEPAAQAVPGEPLERSAPAAPAPATDVAPPTVATTEQAGTPRFVGGRWVAPAPEDETLDAEARARGPSVGRFPDLPPEYWSELRRRDLESRAERERMLLTEQPAP